MSTYIIYPNGEVVVLIHWRVLGRAVRQGRRFRTVKSEKKKRYRGSLDSSPASMERDKRKNPCVTMVERGQMGGKVV